MNRSNSSIWRAWRQTSIKVFVGLNILIIVGFYAATSSFHLGLSHLDEGPASGNADSSNSGRTGEFLLIRWKPNGSKDAFKVIAALFEAMAAPLVTSDAREDRGCKRRPLPVLEVLQ